VKSTPIGGLDEIGHLYGAEQLIKTFPFWKGTFPKWKGTGSLKKIGNRARILRTVSSNGFEYILREEQDSGTSFGISVKTFYNLIKK
jgi:hypothetical protein